MGLTHCYKTAVFLHLQYIMTVFFNFNFLAIVTTEADCTTAAQRTWWAYHGRVFIASRGENRSGHKTNTVC